MTERFLDCTKTLGIKKEAATKVTKKGEAQREEENWEKAVSKNPKEGHFKEKVPNDDKYTLLRTEESKFTPLGI